MCRITQLIVSYRQAHAEAVEHLALLRVQAGEARQDAVEIVNLRIQAQERQVALLDGIIAQHDQVHRVSASIPERVP